MNQFQLKPFQGYIYIGHYFHKYGKNVPTEKKIGLVYELLDIPQIDDYAFSLDFEPTSIFLVENVETVYKALLAILDHDNLHMNWFEDAENNLDERVTNFMSAIGFARIEDLDGDGIPDHLQ